MTEFVVGALVAIAIIVIAWVVMKKSALKKAPIAPTVSAPTTTAAAVASGVAPPASEAAAWTREESVNYVWGQVEPGAPSADGNVKFLGIKGSAAECEDSCGSLPWCRGYSWADASTGSFSKTCYGLSNTRLKVADPGYSSGEKERFSSTLMRRVGMETAGKQDFSAKNTTGTFDSYKQNFTPKSTTGSFDAYKQNFRSGADVAHNTMWGGMQRSAVLPI